MDTSRTSFSVAPTGFGISSGSTARVFRITNVRGNATTVGSGASLTPTTIVAG